MRFAWLAVVVMGCGTLGAGPVQVVSARQGSGHVDSDDNLLQLMVQVTNTSAEPLPVNAGVFRLKTRAGLLVPPIAARSLRWVLGSQPEASVALAAGATYPDLELAFDVPASQAESLELDLPTLHASAPITLEACASCGGVCTYLDVEKERCCDGETPVGGSCVDHLATCPAGKTVCGGAEKRACVDLATSSANCGACGNAVPSGGFCSSGAAACRSREQLCTLNGREACIDLSENAYACGSCGNSCQREGLFAFESITLVPENLCNQGVCDGWARNDDKLPCTQRCQELGMQCSDDNGFKCGWSEFDPYRGGCGTTSAYKYDNTNIPGGGGTRGTYWQGVSCATRPDQTHTEFKCHCVR